MSAESDLWTALKTSTALIALVSDRIYPDLVPQEVPMPCVAYLRQSTEYVSTIHSTAPVAEVVVFEVYCMAATRASAEAVTNAVMAAAATARFRPTDRQMMPPEEDSVIGTVITLERTTPL